MKNIFKKTAGTILAISIICTAMAGCTASDNGNDKSNATEKATQAVANEQTKTEQTKTEPTKTGAFVIKAGPYEDVEDLGFSGDSVVKNLSANAGDTGDVSSIPGLGRFPGGGNGNPLQYSCLENSMDRGSWWATVHGVTKNQIQLSMHTS